MNTINCNGKLIDLNEPKVMGIINVTPDSFYSGSRVQQVEQIVSKAAKMLEEGATFLDIGGYSSRPNAEDISIEEETKRVVEPIREIVKQFPKTIISIDTFRSEVAEKAITAGAQIINDISAGHLDDKMHDLVKEMQVPYIAMHMKGTPQTMNQMNSYNDIIKEMVSYFADVLDKLNKIGVNDVIIDPGFGFSKNPGQNFELLKHLDYFNHLERPILVGVSRKSMIYKTLKTQPEDALNGTTVLNTFALMKGASILRVHDVKEAVEAVKLFMKIEKE